MIWHQKAEYAKCVQRELFPRICSFGLRNGSLNKEYPLFLRRHNVGLRLLSV